MPQLLREKATGRIGFASEIDPYGIRASGEIMVSFSPIKSPDAYVGGAYPRGQFEEVTPEEVPPHIRRKYQTFTARYYQRQANK